MEAIYEFIEADSSESAAAWFNKLSEAVYSFGAISQPRNAHSRK
jgi:hypothetical protein